VGWDSERDLKSHAMRSKLLSLHLILTILHNHPAVFSDPGVIIHSVSTKEQTQFTQAVKQYLCLSLSRNAVSPVLAVFELSCEIFWRALSTLRGLLKKEIEVLLNEIFLPILEMRNATLRQKSVLLGIFSRLCADPQALVEIYLNYDCDRASLENIYERLVNVISKMGTTQIVAPISGASHDRAMSPADSAANAFPFPMPSISPAFQVAAHDPTIAPEAQLKRQSLEAIIQVLRSLVVWAGKGTGNHPEGPLSDSASSIGRQSEDIDERDRSSNATPDIGGVADDPSRFENAKQRKTALLEGIRKFNFKPKRVCVAE
jgi:brefeldin A-inhibited guanine nucleotide-exchange protein